MSLLSRTPSARAAHARHEPSLGSNQGSATERTVHKPARRADAGAAAYDVDALVSRRGDHDAMIGRRTRAGLDPAREHPAAADPAAGEPSATSADRDETQSQELTIDDLAAASRLPSRTIRFYQSAGALPPPERRGRVAFYGPQHVERLRLIGQLQDRGLRIRAIRELVGRIDRGELALDEWLGLEEQLQTGWSEEATQVLTREAMTSTLGLRRPGVLAELVRHRVVEAREDGTYLIRSPGLLKVALRLEEAGLDVETAAAAHEILSKHLRRASEELAAEFMTRAGERFAGDDGVERLTGAIRELRSVAQDAVRLVFAREMERVLRGLVESGKAATTAGKAKKKPKSAGSSGRWSTRR